MKLLWLMLACAFLSACSDDKSSRSVIHQPEKKSPEVVSRQLPVAADQINQPVLFIRNGLVSISAVDVSQLELLQQLSEKAGFVLQVNYQDWTSVSLTMTEASVVDVIKAILGPVPHRIIFLPDASEPEKTVQVLLVGNVQEKLPVDVSVQQSVAEERLEKMSRVKPEQLEQISPISRDQVMAMTDEEKVKFLPYVEASDANIPVLIELLNTYPDVDVRIAAMASLENAENPRAVEAIIGLLADRDPKIVLAAIDSIEFAGSAANVQSLQSLLQHPDPDVQSAAREAIDFLR